MRKIFPMLAIVLIMLLMISPITTIATESEQATAQPISITVVVPRPDYNSQITTYTPELPVFQPIYPIHVWESREDNRREIVRVYELREADFNLITSFNTPDMVFAIGEATSDLSEQVLRDVEQVVKKYERQKANELAINPNNERTVEYEYNSFSDTNPTNNSGELRGGIQSSGGLPASNYSTDGEPQRETIGQIRNDEKSISERESSNNLRDDAVQGTTIPPLQGSGGSGRIPPIAGNERIISESDSSQQDNQSNGMDSGNEHTQSTSGGTGTTRTDLRRDLEDVESENEIKSDTPVSPPPVFFVNWDNANRDFDLNMYQDSAVIGYDIDGVKHQVGKMGDFSYITSTGSLWGSNEVPSDIYKQIEAYRNGEVTNEQVRENYLAVLETYKAKQAKQHTKYDKINDKPLQNDTTPAQSSSQLGTTKISELLSASSITLDEVDSILRDGGNSKKSVLRIVAHFAKNMPDYANAEYLKDEYLKGRYKHYNGYNGGKGFQFGTNKFSTWFNEDGIKIGRGNSAIHASDSVLITWEQAAERIKELYDLGHFVNHDILDEALNNEYLEVADNLLTLYRDSFRDYRELPESWTINGTSWDKILERIVDLLKSDDEYATIVNNLRIDIDGLQTEPNAPVLRRRDPKTTAHELGKLNIKPKGFPVTTIRNITPMRFITDDEIDSFLTKGSNYSEGKMRLLSYFLHNKSTKERVNFLKNEYGYSGGSWIDGFSNAEPGKGITLERPNCDNVNLSWDAVTKRIGNLIQTGRYINLTELERIPNYEKLMLARQIKNFFDTLPEDERKESPFINELDFYYPKRTEWEALHSFLDDSESVEDCIERMQYIMENTLVEDRYYKTRRVGFDNLNAYNEGNYSLFPNIDKLQQQQSLDTTTPSTNDMFSRSLPVPSTELQQPTMFDVVPSTNLPTTIEQRESIDKKASVPVDTPTLPVIEITPEPEKQEFPKTDWELYVEETSKDITNYTEPFVIIKFSESSNFNRHERLTFSQADKKFKDVEATEIAQRIKDGKNGGYNKTEGAIFYKDNPNDTELSAYTFRYDIGDYNDEQSGLYNHINNYWTYVQNALNGGKHHDSVKAMGYSTSTLH